jgi:hypothetical protein
MERIRRLQSTTQLYAILFRLLARRRGFGVRALHADNDFLVRNRYFVCHFRIRRSAEQTPL